MLGQVIFVKMIAVCLKVAFQDRSVLGGWGHCPTWRGLTGGRPRAPPGACSR